MALVSKAFQDIITFSRASSGTYVNSSGYITNSSVLNYLTYSNQPENAAWTKSNSFVQQNLMSYSEQFENTFWASSGSITTAVVANTAISPIGTLTADTATFNVTTPIVRAQPALLITNGTPYTLSVWVRASSSGGAANVRLTVNNSASWVGALSNKVALTSEWQRVTLTWTSSATTLYFVIGASDNTGAVDATCYGNVDVWGAQLVQGSVPGDYRATTSAALPCLYADYNGALRARKLCETSGNSTHSISQSITTTATPYTFSKYYKQPADGSARRYVLMYHSQSNAGWVFDLQTGTAGVGGTTGVNAPVSYAIVSVGSGWYRCQIVVNATAASNAFLTYIVDNNGSSGSVYTGDGSSGIYIADAQMNDGSSALAYYDTTASAYNAPRFDYDPVTIAAKGLLVEEQRANLLTYSNAFTTAPWTVRGTATATPNAALSPDGTNNAWLIAGINVLTNDVFQQITVASGVAYSPSFYIKKVTATGTLQVANPAGTNGTMNINLALLGSGWERITTSHPAVTVTTAFAGSAGNTGGLHLLAPTTGPLSFYLYGSQCELGAFATSYIPTVASQVTRAGDFASVNTLSPWFNNVAGTLYSEFDAYGGTNANRFYEFASDTTNSINGFLGTSTVYMEWVTVSGASQAQLNTAGSPTQINKVGAAYKANDFAASLNGAAPVTDAAGTVPVVNALYLGNSVTGTQQLNGHLRRITYYPRRLTNAELQTLTTL